MPPSTAHDLHVRPGMARSRHTIAGAAASSSLCLLVGASAPAPAAAQTESALPAYAAPLFRVEGWVERVRDTVVTLRAPDGRPLQVDVSELGAALPAALTPGRLVGVTVIARADGSLSARSVTLAYGAPPPTGPGLD